MVQLKNLKSVNHKSVSPVYFLYYLIILFLLNSCLDPDSDLDGVNQDKAYKDLMIQISDRAYQRELTSGTGGDISVRIPEADYFIIKGTKNCLGDLNYEKLSAVGLDGHVFDDSPQPSHETNIHCALYKLRKEIGAIMHMHSPYATAWATAGKLIPPITQQSVNVLNGIKIIPYFTPGTEELLNAVLN